MLNERFCHCRWSEYENYFKTGKTYVELNARWTSTFNCYEQNENFQRKKKSSLFSELMYSAKTSRKHCTKSKYIAQALGLTCEFHIFSIFCFRLTDWKRTRTLVKVSPGLFYISTGFSSCQNFQSLFSSFHLLLTDQRDHPTTRFSTCKSFPCFISKPSNGNWNWRKFWLPPLIRMFSLSLSKICWCHFEFKTYWGVSFFLQEWIDSLMTSYLSHTKIQ